MMNKNQPLTVGVLRQVLTEELNKNGESIKSELRKEITENGESIKNELRKEITDNGESIKSKLLKSLKEQEERIGRHLDAVYGDFENKQAIMAEGIVTLNDKVSDMEISIASIDNKIDSLGGRVYFLEHKFKPAH
jgi:hypothetical protein